MCGIFALLYNSHSNPNEKYRVIDLFNEIKGRGPEQSTIHNDIIKKYSFGFHRLAINGLDLTSGQPLCYERCILLCNGEIFFLETISPKLIIISNYIKNINLRDRLILIVKSLFIYIER